MSPGISRRRLLGAAAATIGTAAAGTVAGGTVLDPAQALAKGRPGQDLLQVPATENLMYEHGVLKRVLLVYGEAGRRIAAGQELPADALHGAATLIHDYIEGFHEAIEEGYVFPRLRKAGVLVSTVETLLTQHARGRQLTQAILAAATTAGLANAATAAAVAHDLALFVRMYEPHEAREDTVVFPAYRALLSGSELAEMAQTLSSDQTSQFGRKAFADAVAQVTRIEATLGIGDLARFTPPAASGS